MLPFPTTRVFNQRKAHKHGADKSGGLRRSRKREEFGAVEFTRDGGPVRATRSDMAVNAAPTGPELDALAGEAENVRARIVTKKGDIVFRFYPHQARQHCAAFIKLARAGFYDGLAFHRVEPGFVIQGGDPSGDGTGGPGYHLDAEFNDLPHVLGTVAMARAASPNSAGSQFYICLGDARFLDKQYTVFGQTAEGEEVLGTIRRGDVMEKVTIEPIP